MIQYTIKERNFSHKDYNHKHTLNVDWIQNEFVFIIHNILNTGRSLCNLYRQKLHNKKII